MDKDLIEEKVKLWKRKQELRKELEKVNDSLVNDYEDLTDEERNDYLVRREL